MFTPEKDYLKLIFFAIEINGVKLNCVTELFAPLKAGYCNNCRVELLQYKSATQQKFNSSNAADK